MSEHVVARRIFELVVVAMVSAVLLPASAAANSDCPLRANKEAAPGPALKPQISLEATPATEVTNFGGSRGIKEFYALFKASKPLPETLKPGQLEIAVPRPPRRVSENLESASLPFPRFGVPKFINGRREIQILTCIDASGAEAGTYTGQISVNGPSGFTGATVTTTINAKNELWFWISLVVVLFAAGVLLWFLKVDKELKTVPQKLVAIGVSAVLAGVAMWSIYDKDPAWGADIITNLIALAGTGFGAIGIGNLVSPIVRKTTPQT